MKQGVKIVGIIGLAVTLVSGLANAQTRNPWAFYQGGNQFQDNRALVSPQPTRPLATPPTARTQPLNRAVPQTFGNEYVPLENNRIQQPWFGMVPGQPMPGNYGPYGYRPFGGYPRYGFQQPFQMPFQGNFGGQFGFGIGQNSGFGGSRMPFGYPSMPLFGGGNPYGNRYGSPFGGFSPWGMGFPMF